MLIYIFIVLATYTYGIKIALARYGKEVLKYKDPLADSTSPQYIRLALATHEGLDRMVMQSDLRDIYHGVQINKFEPNKDNGIINEFYVQVLFNFSRSKILNIKNNFNFSYQTTQTSHDLRKYLRNILGIATTVLEVLNSMQRANSSMI